MSERGQFRNTRGPRGGGRGGRGGAQKHSDGGGQAGGSAADKDKERPKKENILDLNRFMDKQMKVKFNGGREGKGFRKISRSWAAAAVWVRVRCLKMEADVLDFNLYSCGHAQRIRSAHECGAGRCQGGYER
jgi:hypothetical protein